MYPLILAFHKIIPDEYTTHPYYWKDICTPYSTFVSLLESLYQENFAFISLQELEYAQINPHERTVLLTFDDGYYNNVEYAYPLLKAENIPFVMAINGKCIENSTWQWFDKIWYYGIQEHKTEIERIKTIQTLKYDLPTLQRWLSTHPKPEYYNSIQRIFFDIATVQELNSIENVSFVSHTYSHYILTALSDVMLETEIRKNIDFALKNHLSLQSSYFVLPNGTKKDFDKRTIDILTKNEVKNIFTMLPYIKQEGLLARYTPYHNTWARERKRYFWQKFLCMWR
ncbi:MAG: polysaccharide deacetylase family protein [Bacteroidia bacterium]|nr:polysaccharide deacetylase family protein [Bacteroidia bacterium]MDW8348264.1 polysaccharide deacetylase family protein [Bacteroidia bacterium]